LSLLSLALSSLSCFRPSDFSREKREKGKKGKIEGVQRSACVSHSHLRKLALAGGTPSRFIEPIRMADSTPHRAGKLAKPLQLIDNSSLTILI